MAKWLELNSNDSGVLGWVVHDFRPALPWVRFTSHSVIAINNGDDWVDITPSTVVQEYPFLAAGLGQQRYFELEEQLIAHHGVSQFDWIPAAQ
jgi:hypothetical protein